MRDLECRQLLPGKEPPPPSQPREIACPHGYRCHRQRFQFQTIVNRTGHQKLHNPPPNDLFSRSTHGVASDIEGHNDSYGSFGPLPSGSSFCLKRQCAPTFVHSRRNVLTLICNTPAICAWVNPVRRLPTLSIHSFETLLFCCRNELTIIFNAPERCACENPVCRLRSRSSNSFETLLFCWLLIFLDSGGGERGGIFTAAMAPCSREG